MGEAAVGIEEYVSDCLGFTGILKHRCVYMYNTIKFPTGSMITSVLAWLVCI